MIKLDLDIRENGSRVIAAQTGMLEEESAFKEALSGMSGYRRRKVESFRFAKDRLLCLLAGLLLDELLRDVGLRERDMAYVEGAQGKPAFAGRDDIHFSLAHSGRMAVAALAFAPIGVDIEHLPSFAYDVAEPFAWTKMESVGKLLGCGVGEFVDGAAFSMPEGVVVQHIELNGYLICIARETGLP